MGSIKKISILGCGWLGLPLAEALIAEGFIVKGSTTREEKVVELQERGIDPYIVRLSPDIEDEDTLISFLGSDVLIINIPPGTKKNPDSNFHILQINNLLSFLEDVPVEKVIYISSTSVYPNLNRSVTEEDVLSWENAGNSALFGAEELIRNFCPDYLVLRLAGLTGYDRMLVNYFSGKSDLPQGNTPVNLIHRDDVVGIIKHLLESNNWNKTYNICAPQNPLRKDYYSNLARIKKLPEPHFNSNDSSSFKSIDITKFQKDIKYNFKYPDPLQFYQE